MDKMIDDLVNIFLGEGCGMVHIAILCAEATAPNDLPMFYGINADGAELQQILSTATNRLKSMT